MDYSQLRNFKLRYFIIFAIGIFTVSIIMFFFVDVPGIQEWVSLFISLSCLLYIVYQSKKWNFTYDEQKIADTMTKGRWVRYLSLSASLQLMITVLSTFLLTLLYVIFEEQIRDFFEIFLLGGVEVGPTPLIVYILFFINICILAPIWEELLFRGILLRRFTLKWSPQKSIIVSSIIFGIIHLNPLTVIFAFALGCLLGYAYLKTKSILVPMLIHSFSNFLAFLQFCIANQTTQVDLPTTAAARQELYMVGGIFLILLSVALFLIIKYFNRFRQLTIQHPTPEAQAETETI